MWVQKLCFCIMFLIIHCHHHTNQGCELNRFSFEFKFIKNCKSKFEFFIFNFLGSVQCCKNYKITFKKIGRLPQKDKQSKGNNETGHYIALSAKKMFEGMQYSFS